MPPSQRMSRWFSSEKATVRIEPNLIANETNPSARLTIGQDITAKLNLIYSMDLINSSDQIYVGDAGSVRVPSSQVSLTMSSARADHAQQMDARKIRIIRGIGLK